MHAALAFMPSFSLPALFKPRPMAPACSSAPADIPNAFSEGQARQILVLKTLGARRDDAVRILRGKRQALSGAQIDCAAGLLALGLDDFCLSLADAMAPCALRGQLMRRRIVEDEALVELRRAFETQVVDLARTTRQSPSTHAADSTTA